MSADTPSDELVPHGFGYKPEGDRPFTCRFLGTGMGKVQAFSALQRLSGMMVRSGTVAALETWCREHKLAADPTLVLRLVPGATQPFTKEVASRLEVEDEAAATYRHIEMRCGELLLGWADTWYVPHRLPPGLGESLAADVLFEQAAEPMRPVRIGVQNTLLWAPFRSAQHLAAPSAGPAEGGRSAHRPLLVPWRVFEHRTVLRNAGLNPMSLTLETFTREVLSVAAEVTSQPEEQPAPLVALPKHVSIGRITPSERGAPDAAS